MKTGIDSAKRFVSVRSISVCLPALILGAVCLSPAPLFAAEVRPAWTTSQLAGIPEPPPPYRVDLVFPKLSFTRPVDLTFAPGSDRMFVVEQDGKIHSFVNDQATEKSDLVVDLKKLHPMIGQVYALTFHPDFERNRYAYVCCLYGGERPDGSQIVRYEVSRTDPPTFDAATEKIVYTWKAGGHNGCCLKFGLDGYLYISTGDGTGPDPPDALRSGQDITTVMSCILRIDVDHEEGDKPYRIPPDNPFVDLPGARPEIWSYGYRNPWRMSIDRKTGDLWVGDVGWQLWEMIYRVEKGGNYGWSIMEGPQPALPNEKRGPTPILPPTIAHPHSEASSITGGLVYYGDRLPELQGVYIYGDFQSGTIWGARHDGKQVTWHKVLANTPLQLVSFSEDRSGELYFLDYERSKQIYRLIKNPDEGRTVNFPRRLSETGIFSSLKEQTPATGVLPYAINARHWADHTSSERWLAIPGTDPIKVEANGNWEFPNGAVLAKTVSIPLQEGAPPTRLETQVLHREEGTWRPYTYVWNDEQTDAELAPASGSSRLLKIADSRAPEGIREQTYRFASRAECQLCHNPWVEKKTTIYGFQTASPLAVNIPQLNRPSASGATTENQLAVLQQQGWLAGMLPPKLEEAAKYSDPYDTAGDLNQRVRSYLQVNCSHCHQVHAGGAATIILTYETKPGEMKAIDVRPAQGTFGIADARIIASADPLGSVLHYRIAKVGGGRMPRLGSEVVDEQAVAMIHDWIAQLPRPATETKVHPDPLQDAATIAALQSTVPETRTAAISQLISSTRGALALLRLLDRGGLSPEARREVIALTAEHPQSEVRDLFERFVPAAQRLKRLGNAINPAELLALPADVDRGRELFFREGAAACKTCHQVKGKGETLGPDLSLIGKKYARPDLLSHLLEPSKFIEPKFILYTLETVEGRVFSGLLVEKNDREVVLKDVRNQPIRVAAGDVEMLVPQQKSLMPELLLRDLTAQQAADLLTFLSSLK